MKNKIMIVIYPILLAISILSFTNDNQGSNPITLVGDRANEKAIFNYNQAIYNDQPNKDIRAKGLVEKKVEDNELDNKKIQDEQDKNKGQFIVKF